MLMNDLLCVAELSISSGASKPSLRSAVRNIDPGESPTPMRECHVATHCDDEFSVFERETLW